MTGWKLAGAICAILAVAGPSAGQGLDREIGGDLLRLGATGTPLQAARDVLAAGDTVMLDGTIAQDAQAAGLDVDVDATTGGDLTAMGFSVNLRGPVGGDLTAIGFSLRTGRAAEVAGNARLAGGRVIIDGPVKGALAAAAGKITLNAVVTGDAVLAGEDILFGPDARIDGTLTYSSPDRITIPATVIAADRITYEPYARSEMMTDAREMWRDRDYPVLPGFLSLLGGFLVTLGFFVVIGALFLTLVPHQVRRLRRSIEARPGMSLVTGVIGLSMLFGMVPIMALTIVGLPMVPIVVLALITVWTLGYVLGAYVLAMRALRSFGTEEDPAIWVRLLALVLGVSFVALLNFIPVLGWVANFTLVLLGIGGMTTALFERMVGNIGPALDADMRPIDPDV